MAAYMKDGTSNSDSVNEVMAQMNELAEHMEGSSTDPAALQEQSSHKLWAQSDLAVFGHLDWDRHPLMFLEVDIGGHKSRIVSSKLKFRNKFKSNFNGIKCSLSRR
ncbi:unnamed protein product [Camellia sinensis]